MGLFKGKAESPEEMEDAPGAEPGPGGRGRRPGIGGPSRFDRPQGPGAPGRAPGGPPQYQQRYRRDSRRGRHVDDRIDRGTEPGEGEGEEEEQPESWKVTAFGLVRDVTIAVIIMLIIIGAMWGYTKNWPPMVVVESASMMHAEESSVGVIDTGDLVLVKKIDSRSDITTYFEGKSKNYKMYDEYGDVIIYKKDGGADTPVIHRAIFWLEYDEEATMSDPSNAGSSIPQVAHFNIPELNLFDLRGDLRNPSVGTEIDSNFPAYAEGEQDGPLVINLGRIYELMKNDPHSGYITKGDHNPISSIDQYQTSTPVKVDWIIGKAKGELPWFGLIKLYVSGSLEENPAPPNSVNMLIFTIALLIIIPISIDVAYAAYVNRKKAREEERLGMVREEPLPPGRRGPERGGPPVFRGRGGGGKNETSGRPDEPDQMKGQRRSGFRR
ncbi:MAG: S26 family signal peptidase [Thermoplasmata archaeon]|nr:MAG: S26 family signal peptidase [Thermoplasmata archaeon]